MENPKEYYESNINRINKNLRELERIILTFAVLRLIIVIVGIAVMYYLYKADKFIYLCASFLATLLIFILTAIFHNNKINEKLLKKYNAICNKEYNNILVSDEYEMNLIKEEDALLHLPFCNDNSIFWWFIHFSLHPFKALTLS